MSPDGNGTLVLGIDPGTRATGFGLIAIDGNRFRHVTHGAWRPQAGTTSAERLAHLATELEAFIAEWRPRGIAIEQAFLGKNGAEHAQTR